MQIKLFDLKQTAPMFCMQPDFRTVVLFPFDFLLNFFQFQVAALCALFIAEAQPGKLKGACLLANF